MGKIFPLSEKASLFEATVELIEKSFHYKRPNSFEIDFAPLIDKSNHHNCFILIDEDEKVLAHIGVKERNILLGGRTFPVILIGGIAVDESRRGEGIFHTLFQDVLAEKRSDTSFFILWSDLEKLYNKYGFYLCGSQFEIQSKTKVSGYEKTSYLNLTTDEKKKVRRLFEESFSNQYITLYREDKDWEEIGKITSADLFIARDKELITSYYFQNKGQDLPGIIYEYGTSGNWQEFLETISHFGKVWMGKEYIPTENLQYEFFLAPGDLKLFTGFIRAISRNKIEVLNINVMKQEIYFDYNGETLALSIQEFLGGVFGPQNFEELELPPVFLSGLDSI